MILLGPNIATSGGLGRTILKRPAQMNEGLLGWAPQISFPLPGEQRCSPASSVAAKSGAGGVTRGPKNIRNGPDAAE
jgi:hypothetical protein